MAIPTSSVECRFVWVFRALNALLALVRVTPFALVSSNWVAKAVAVTNERAARKAAKALLAA
jgi:hypothetical protein